MDKKKRILFVDDEPDIAKLVIFRLRKEDFEVTSVDCGGEALKLAEANPPDLILLDLMLPDMDGYTVCRKMRLIDSLRSTPVIFFTASVVETLKLEEKIKEAGGQDYVVKPFVAEELIGKIRRYI